MSKLGICGRCVVLLRLQLTCASNQILDFSLILVIICKDIRSLRSDPLRSTMKKTNMLDALQTQMKHLISNGFFLINFELSDKKKHSTTQMFM